MVVTNLQCQIILNLNIIISIQFQIHFAMIQDAIVKGRIAIRKDTKIKVSSQTQYFNNIEQQISKLVHNLQSMSQILMKLSYFENLKWGNEIPSIVNELLIIEETIQKIQKECIFFVETFVKDSDQYIIRIEQLKILYNNQYQNYQEYKVLVQKAQIKYKLMQQQQIKFQEKYQQLLQKFNNLINNISQYKQLIQNYKSRLQDKKLANKAIIQQLQQTFVTKRKLNNQLQERKGNVRVYCRIRPLSSFNITDKQKQKYYEVINDTALLMKVPKDVLRSQNHKKQFYYNFQMIFDNSTQTAVFNQLAQLIQSSLDGKNVCIFAYGQTGSGKTYTMQGGQDNHRGVIPRSVQYIFNQIERAKIHGWNHQILVSVQEVYMQSVRDLLIDNFKNQKYQKSQDTVTQVCVDSPQAIQTLLNAAKQNRKVAQTQCNQRSSRSHCIFTLKIKGKNDKQIKQGSLNLIDLAGSQRISQSKVEGDRLKQTLSINKSLTQLSTVITSLAKKEQHIPYRNSKLTFLLQPYLSGDSKTLMMVNISPLPENYQQTVCSLRFAETVRECIINKT